MCIAVFINRCLSFKEICRDSTGQYLGCMQEPEFKQNGGCKRPGSGGHVYVSPSRRPSPDGPAVARTAGATRLRTNA